MRSGVCVMALALLSGCESVQLIQPKATRHSVATALLLGGPALTDKNSRFRLGCIEGIRDAKVILAEQDANIPLSGETVYEQLANAAKADAIINLYYTSYSDDDAFVGPSEVWLMNRQGHILASALFRADTSTGEAQLVARRLCRAVLTGRTK